MSCRIPFDVRCGKNGPGAWLSFGSADNADDQTPDDELSATFTSEPLDDNLSIVGFPWLLLGISVDNHDGGVVIARLCDVSADDKQSTLITYGVLNLTHVNGHSRDQVKALEPGKQFDARVELHSTGYTLPPGHRLRVSLSASWWPGVWPSSKAVQMTLHHAKLNVPVYTGSEDRKELVSMLLNI
jgi:predicted acyl esterase